MNKNFPFTRKHKLSYLIGAFLGDGCVYIGKSAYQFSITSSDYCLVKICHDLCEELFKKSGKIKAVHKNGKLSHYQLVICSKKICNFLSRITKNRQYIPYIKDVESRKFIAAGLMDSDGWICKVNAGDGYLRYRMGFKAINFFVPYFMKDILPSIGVKTGSKMIDLKITKRCPSHTYYFTINTKTYAENMFFMIDRKESILQEYREKTNVS